MQLINIGFGNMVSSARVIAIVSPESAPIKYSYRRHLRQKNKSGAYYGQRPCGAVGSCT